MRLVTLAALLFVGTNLSTTQADDFPYEAFVLTDEAEVLAGPGHRFYATERLSRGTKVEIYREEPSGWLAIRPPDASFSWVPAEFVERLDEDSLGRVKESAGAWVGTSVERVKEHHQQLTLKPGELVQILGEKSISGASGKEQAWLKIAPPAGEYRWIHLRDVSRQKPAERAPEILTEAENSSEPQTVSPAIFRGEQEPTEQPRRFTPAPSAIALRDLTEVPAPYLRTVELAQLRSSAAVESRPLSPDGFVPRKRRDGDPSSTTAPIRTTTTTTSTATSNARLDADARLATASPKATINHSTSLGGDELSRQLNQIELDLSLMVSQEPAQRNFADLKRRVEPLVDGAADPVSRGRARLLLDKIKQFDNAFGRDARTVSTGSASRTTDATIKSEPQSASLADPRYDAQGWLKPVVSRKSDKPVAPYAVVDAEGQPLCFVSPSPGLNLHRYENKQVGLYGRRGYLESLKKPHLVAERVIELDSRWR